MIENNIYGFIKSNLDGTEAVLSDNKYKSLPIPNEYSYLEYMSPILNQGKTSTCVPHAISASFDYYLAVKKLVNGTKDGTFSNSGISINQIYDSRKDKVNGMTYKSALDFCKYNGVTTENEYKNKNIENNIKILEYALIPNLEIMKMSLIANGPCLIATYVKNTENDYFWRGNNNCGGHATSIIGYSDKTQTLLLRNSWGTSFGNGGYIDFPYEDYSKIIEAWAIII